MSNTGYTIKSTAYWCTCVVQLHKCLVQECWQNINCCLTVVGKQSTGCSAKVAPLNFLKCQIVKNMVAEWPTHPIFSSSNCQIIKNMAEPGVAPPPKKKSELNFFCYHSLLVNIIVLKILGLCFFGSKKIWVFSFEFPSLRLFLLALIKIKFSSFEDSVYFGSEIFFSSPVLGTLFFSKPKSRVLKNWGHIFRCNRLDGCISRNRIFTDSLTNRL